MWEPVGEQPLQREVSAWQGLLLLVISALFAWGPEIRENARLSADQAEIGQIEDRFHTGPGQVAPAEEADQDDLETLPEQVEDPLAPLAEPEFELRPSPEGDPGEHGAVIAWAVCTPVFRSSSARGPPTV